MRFLIREQEFETPLASGSFRYEKKGIPTGVVENWRWSKVMNDYTFLRIDLDKRKSDREESILFHLLLNPLGEPERIKARLLSMESTMLSDISIQEESAFITGEVNGKRVEDEKTWKRKTVFWFRTVLGFGLLVRTPSEAKELLGMEFNFSTLGLRNQTIAISKTGKTEVLDMGHQKFVARPYLISLDDQSKQIWLDDDDWPIRMDFGNNLMAIDTQPIRYQ